MVTNTVTESGHFTITDQGVHIPGTSTQDYRIDFADGRYLVTSSPSHFEFTATSGGLTVYTEAQQDRGTLYSADGQPIGIVSVFTLTHTTWRDSDRQRRPRSRRGHGRRQPIPGDLPVAFRRTNNDRGALNGGAPLCHAPRSPADSRRAGRTTRAAVREAARAAARLPDRQMKGSRFAGPFSVAGARYGPISDRPIAVESLVVAFLAHSEVAEGSNDRGVLGM